VEPFSKDTDLTREQLEERRSGLGRACDICLLGFDFRQCAMYRGISFWSLLISVLCFYNRKWRTAWVQGMREKVMRREQDKNPRKAI